MNLHPDPATFWSWVVAIVGGAAMGLGWSLYSRDGIRRDQGNRLEDLDAAMLLERHRQSGYERNPWD
jgi:hypothetical protein